EIELGSDRYSSDSDGNGVSDGVEYAATGRPCRDDQCSLAGAEPYTQCSNFLAGEVSGRKKYKDRDRDFLNDCEESNILESDRDQFDTNGDLVPDHLAFHFGLPFVAG